MKLKIILLSLSLFNCVRSAENSEYIHVAGSEAVEAYKKLSKEYGFEDLLNEYLKSKAFMQLRKEKDKNLKLEYIDPENIRIVMVTKYDIRFCIYDMIGTFCIKKNRFKEWGLRAVGYAPNAIIFAPQKK